MLDDHPGFRTASARKTPSPCSPAPRNWPAAARDIINLGIGQPDFRTPEHIVEAAIKALRDGHHGYTPANGLLATREAVVRRTLATTGDRGVAGRVMIMPGGKPTMYRGDPDVRRAGRGDPLSRSGLPHLPLDDRVHRRDAGAGAGTRGERLRLLGRGDAVADHAETRLLILNSPANPTGGVTPRNEIEKLVKGLEDHPHVAILSDEIYDVMTYDGETHTSLLDFPGRSATG